MKWLFDTVNRTSFRRLGTHTLTGPGQVLFWIRESTVVIPCNFYLSMAVLFWGKSVDTCYKFWSNSFPMRPQQSFDEIPFQRSHVVSGILMGVLNLSRVLLCSWWPMSSTTQRQTYSKLAKHTHALTFSQLCMDLFLHGLFLIIINSLYKWWISHTWIEQLRSELWLSPKLQAS